jgi:hypothetical protein
MQAVRVEEHQQQNKGHMNTLGALFGRKINPEHHATPASTAGSTRSQRDTRVGAQRRHHGDAHSTCHQEALAPTPGAMSTQSTTAPGSGPRNGREGLLASLAASILLGAPPLQKAVAFHRLAFPLMNCKRTGLPSGAQRVL